MLVVIIAEWPARDSNRNAAYILGVGGYMRVLAVKSLVRIGKQSQYADESLSRPLDLGNRQIEQYCRRG